MAKLLQLSRPSKGVSNAVRAWWAMRSQKRRRERNAGMPVVIPAPVVTGGLLVVSELDPEWLDAIVNFTFDGVGLPAGALCVQSCVGSDYGFWEDRLTVPVGTTQFRDDMVFTGQNDVYYRMRFVSGDLTGPFSAECNVRL